MFDVRRPDTKLRPRNWWRMYPIHFCPPPSLIWQSYCL